MRKHVTRPKSCNRSVKFNYTSDQPIHFVCIGKHLWRQTYILKKKKTNKKEKKKVKKKKKKEGGGARRREGRVVKLEGYLPPLPALKLECIRLHRLFSQPQKRSFIQTCFLFTFKAHFKRPTASKTFALLKMTRSTYFPGLLAFDCWLERKEQKHLSSKYTKSNLCWQHTTHSSTNL